jgi:hypothetical protein
MPKHVGWPDGMATEGGDSGLQCPHLCKEGTAHAGATEDGTRVVPTIHNS